MLRLLTCLSLFCFLSIPVYSAAYATAPKAEKYLQDGTARLARGDDAGALIQFENATRSNPDNMQAMLFLGEALISAERFDRAESVLRVVLKKAPSANVEVKLAEALYAKGEWRAAYKFLTQRDTDPAQEALGYILEAEKALQDNHSSKALALTQLAADTDHYTRPALLVQARAYYALGKANLALATLDKLEQEGVDYYQASLLKAHISLQSNDIARAIEIAQKINDRLPGNISAGAVLVEAHLKLGDDVAAEKVINALVPQMENDPRPRYLAALLSLTSGDYVTADTHISEIMPWLTQTPRGAMLVAQVKYQNNQHRQAEAILKSLLDKQPDDERARALIIMVLNESQDTAKAERYLQDGLALNPASAPLLEALTLLRSSQKRYDEAFLAYQRLAAVGQPTVITQILTISDGTFDQQAPFAIAMMTALSAMRAGNDAEFMVAAREATRQAPDNPLAHNLYAGALMQSGDAQSAKQALAIALNLEPGMISAIMNMAQVEAGEGNENALEGLLLRAIKAAPQRAHLPAHLADYYQARGEGRKAINILAAAIIRLPQEQDLRLRYAALLLKTGNADQAIRVLQNTDDFMALAQAYDQAGRPRKAFTILKAKLEAGRNNPALFETAADYALAAGQKAEAVALVEGLSRVAPARAVVLQAKILLRNGDGAGAIKLLEEALNKAPGGYLARKKYLFQREMAQGNAIKLAVAFVELEKWAVYFPQDAETQHMIGALYFEKRAYQKADKALSLALAGQPANAAIMNDLAWARYYLNDPSSLPLARAAYLKNQKNADFADTYGYLLAKNGKVSQGLMVLQQAVLLAPESPEVQQHLKEVQTAASAIANESSRKAVTLR